MLKLTKQCTNVVVDGFTLPQLLDGSLVFKLLEFKFLSKDCTFEATLTWFSSGLPSGFVWVQLVGLLEKLVLNEKFGIVAITFGYNNPP